MNYIEIYTDGSCLGNPGVGGWACILHFGDKEKIKSGSKKQATNNQMELQAIIEALKTLKTNKYKIKVYTDSSYVKDGITKRIKNWKINNRKTSNKKDVKNKELWIQLDDLTKGYYIERKWVKAHSTNKLNNMVDEIARKQAESISF